jgi:hypothetical protein
MDWTDSPVDPNDMMLPHYLIATWAKVWKAMGPEFEPYLPVVMIPLLFRRNGQSAGRAPDIGNRREVPGV